jgi:hypothetical protein
VHTGPATAQEFVRAPYSRAPRLVVPNLVVVISLHAVAPNCPAPNHPADSALCPLILLDAHARRARLHMCPPGQAYLLRGRLAFVGIVVGAFQQAAEFRWKVDEGGTCVRCSEKIDSRKLAVGGHTVVTPRPQQAPQPRINGLPWPHRPGCWSRHPFSPAITLSQLQRRRSQTIGVQPHQHQHQQKKRCHMSTWAGGQAHF